MGSTIAFDQAMILANGKPRVWDHGIVSWVVRACDHIFWSSDKPTALSWGEAPKLFLRGRTKLKWPYFSEGLCLIPFGGIGDWCLAPFGGWENVKCQDLTPPSPEGVAGLTRGVNCQAVTPFSPFSPFSITGKPRLTCIIVVRGLGPPEFA